MLRSSLALKSHFKTWLAASCLALGSLLVPAPSHAEDWPQWMGPARDDQWKESGILTKFPEGGPKLRWKVAINGGYAGPAVANGRVFVTDYVTSGDRSPDPGKRNELEGTERILCLDEKSGKELWKHEYPCNYRISYPAGPRCTPTVNGDLVYCLGAEGNLFALQVKDGQVAWSRALKEEFKIEAPLWGFSGHPLVEGDQLICLVGGQGSVVVSFDKRTGKELWRALSAAEPGYSPPTMIELGGKRQLVVWHSEALCGLEPKTGKLVWSVPLKPGYGMSIMAPRQSGNLLFAGGIGEQSVLVKLSDDLTTAEEIYRGDNRSSLYPVCASPMIVDDLIFGASDQGAFRAVDLATGDRKWESFIPTTGKRRANSGTAFIVKNGDRFFLFSETGDLIIANLDAKGYTEIDRTKLLEPTTDAFGRLVVWTHPAFANRSVVVRNDKEIASYDLSAP